MRDVVITGFGPAGALLANLLGEAGIDVLVLDRAVGVMEIPRAVHIDGETMRVIQAAGVAREVLALCRPGYGMHWVSAQGETLVIREGHPGLSDQGWHNDYYFHQPELEKALRAGLTRFPHVEIREGVEVLGHAQDADSVTLQTRDMATGLNQDIEARYVIGCDGARSIVRSWIGDEPEDLGQHQAWLVVDVQLHRPLDLPTHTVQHCDPARPATSIYLHALRRRWEIMLLDSDDPQKVAENANVWQLLARWVKPSQGVLERAATYVFHSLLSRRWHKGRLFIAGDAAHQTPPFLGQGLCAAARDVANLAWKLALALERPAKCAILDTYGPERIPHARAFIDLSVQMGKIIQVVDPEQARVRDADLLAKGLSFQFPRPALGPGMHTGDAAMAGKVAPQSVLPDGRWFDDVVGQRFSLLVDASAAPQLSQACRRTLSALGVVLVDGGGQRAQAWLEQSQCVAALIRPDRYVFDTARTVQDIDATVARLARWITP